MLPLKEVQSDGFEFYKFFNNSVIEELTFKQFTYQRIKKNFRGFNYGEVILDFEHIIPQYPSIYRCYNFKKALSNHFLETEKFIVEEKLDGFNVRIAINSNKIYAFTRGGFICPYTTEFLENYPEIKHFLLDNPDKVLCAEVIGENPYNTLSIRMYDSKTRIFVFDIMSMKDVTSKSRKRSYLLPTYDKMQLFNTYKIQTVPLIGIFTAKDYESLKSILMNLNSEKKEGIVVKSIENRKKYIKYATPYADIEAIADHLTKSFECDTAHFRKRLFLIASYLLEFPYSKEEMTNSLSSHLLTSMTTVLQENQKIEEYELTISLENWLELEKLLTRTLKITITSEEKVENGKLRIKFEKYYKKTSEFIRGANAGRLFID